MASVGIVGRYHTNDSGKTLPCTAGVRECRFVHGSSPEEAASNWQNLMADELLPMPASSGPSPAEKLQHYRTLSLKQMDDYVLSEAILLESDTLQLDVQKVAIAIALASDLHGNQFRKGNRGTLANPPYIEHPLRNTLRLIRLGCREESVLNGSTLHDTVEDGSAVFAKRLGWSNGESQNEPKAREALSSHIGTVFGQPTQTVVLAVTNEISPRGGAPLSVEEKHAIYVGHVRAHVLHSPEAFLVKISDFIDNATGLYHGVGSIDPVKLRNQALKYLKTIPVFQEGLATLDLPIPDHSKALLQKALTETEYRLQKIVAGWNGVGKP